MPLHEYFCPQGHTQTKDYPFGKKPASILCFCGKRAKRRISVPNVKFRGDGFTQSTDFDLKELKE